MPFSVNVAAPKESILAQLAVPPSIIWRDGLDGDVILLGIDMPPCPYWSPLVLHHHNYHLTKPKATTRFNFVGWVLKKDWGQILIILPATCPQEKTNWLGRHVYFSQCITYLVSVLENDLCLNVSPAILYDGQGLVSGILYFVTSQPGENKFGVTSARLSQNKINGLKLCDKYR